MPRKSTFLLLLPFLTGPILSGCLVSVRQQAFYVSPFNGNSGDYHPLPMVQDSSHTAVYVRGDYFVGTANNHHTDRLGGGNASLYVAHHTGMLQCYYGLDLSLGSYKLGKWDTVYSGGYIQLPPVNARSLAPYAGRKFFGGAGFSGGANLVAPFGTWEWRFLGIETSLHQEFGDYRSFRKELPDPLATLVVRDGFFGTAGITTEIAGRTPYGEVGVRVASGWVLGSAYHNLHIYDSVARQALAYSYFNASFHYTRERYTGYMQVELGERTTTFHFGLAYRLSRPGLPGLRSRAIHTRQQP